MNNPFPPNKLREEDEDLFHPGNLNADTCGARAVSGEQPLARLSKREARRWVRQHWQDFMRSADCPDLPLDDFGDSIADVFCEESRRLAERLSPRKP